MWKDEAPRDILGQFWNITRGIYPKYPGNHCITYTNWESNFKSAGRYYSWIVRHEVQLLINYINSKILQD